jgi:hypothetical protein
MMSQATQRGQALKLLRRALNDPRVDFREVNGRQSSAWTLTVVAALLREAGSGPVWPIALATSSVGD